MVESEETSETLNERIEAFDERLADREVETVGWGADLVEGGSWIGGGEGHIVGYERFGGNVRAGMPVLKHGRKGVAAAFDVAACVAWVRAQDAARLAPLPKTHEKQPRASRENLREILRGLWLPLDSLLAWHPGCPDVMRLREWEERIGLPHESGEFIDWLQLGCPTLPPLEGERELRVSFRHAELCGCCLAG